MPIQILTAKKMRKTLEFYRLTRNYLLVILLSLVASFSFGEVLYQDSEGASALLLQGGTIGIDLSEASLGFSYNHLFGENPKKSKLVWGLNANIKNKKGTADLLKGGGFLPSTRGSGFIGVRWVDGLSKKHPKKLPLKASTVYIRSGFNASRFYLYDLTDEVELNNNFSKTSFNGFFADLGYNYQVKNWLLGVTIGVVKANNLQFLEEAKYFVLSSVNSNTPEQQMIKQTEYTAYSGNYIENFQFTSRIEALKFFTLSNSHSIAVNPYYRFQGFAVAIDSYYRHQGQSDLPSIQTIGLGNHFFNKKGSFAIGVYVEGYDLSNNAKEYLGSTDKYSFSERINFGLITKIAFSSMLPAEKRK